ncbi:NmrA family NAD(P)-binding protein [Ferruginibacter sp.]
MKITVTGSLGHISLPLTKELVSKGHTVTVISSNAAKQKDIEALGAIAAIGSLEDLAFLTAAFTGADAAYCMEPPPSFFDHSIDHLGIYRKLAQNYKQAIISSGVKQVVHLSSIGGHTNKGNGLLAFHYDVEQVFNQLPDDVSIVFMRPVGFYYNLFAFIPVIKMQDAIVTNYGNIKEPWVATQDIATAIAEEIAAPFKGRKVRYVASEELTCDEVANIIGTAIGKPGLKWVAISNEEMEQRYIAVGMAPFIANALVQMNAGRTSGVLYEDYWRNPPVLGKTKLADFAKEFAAVFNQ